MKKIITFLTITFCSFHTFAAQISTPCLGEAKSALHKKVGTFLTEKEANADSLQYLLKSYIYSEEKIDIVILYSYDNDDGSKTSYNSFIEVSPEDCSVTSLD